MITSLQNTFSFQEMIHIENEAIKIVSSHKHLGLILTPDLDWHHHYKPTSSKRISTCESSAVDVEGFKTINSPAVVHILSPAKT